MAKYTYDYPRPCVTVDIVILRPEGDELKVLLVRRKADPYKGMWAIPGGFVEMDESLEQAAHRELEEETGVTDVEVEQLYTFGAPRRDPRTRVITVAYLAVIDSSRIDIRAGDDAAEAAWHSMSGLPDLAFDHADILAMALERYHRRGGGPA